MLCRQDNKPCIYISHFIAKGDTENNCVETTPFLSKSFKKQRTVGKRTNYFSVFIATMTLKFLSEQRMFGMDIETKRNNYCTPNFVMFVIIKEKRTNGPEMLRHVSPS